MEDNENSAPPPLFMKPRCVSFITTTDYVLIILLNFN